MPAAAIGHMQMPLNFRYRSLFLHGRPIHQKYDAFWRKHPPMDTTHRAKIFSAFDALSGFDDCIASKEVPYCDRRYLCEGEKEALDRKLSVLLRLSSAGHNQNDIQEKHPQITVQYFFPCTDKNNFAYGTGGIYKTITGICRKIDVISGTITVGDTMLSLQDITVIDGDLFESP